MIPSVPIAFWQYVDLIILVPFFALLAGLLAKHYRSNGSFLKTISHTIAASPKSSRIFSLSMTVIAPVYYSFVWFWAAPRMVISEAFYWILVPMLLSELLFVWLPANAVYTKWHTPFAVFTMVGMVAEVVIITLSAKYLSTWAEAMFLAFLGTACIFVAVLVLERLKRYVFLLEVIFCAVFLLAMSLAAHT
ncbi:hypothetical protein IPL68_01630 [Candidatus Saccharibacteria bacterium]|nr:MAG: hypothetical protein IPL68_01630 [Candidatus Saccharibacteria bacterium]